MRIPALDGRRIADASFADRTLTALAARADGRFDRLRFRLDRAFRRFDADAEQDVEPTR